MSVTKRALGQSAPSATTLTDLYTVPSGKQTTVSTIAVTNRSTTTPTRYRLSHAPAGAADALTQYFAYDVPIEAGDSHYITIGITLAATDKLRSYVTDANVTVTAWGAEEDV